MTDAPTDTPRFTTVHLFWMLPWVAVVIAALQPIRDNSFLWHVRAGEIQAATGEVLRTDPFSYTFLGEAWRTQSWMADLLYHWLHGFDGLAFVPWLIGFVALVTLALVGATSYRATNSALATAVALLFVTWLGIAFFSPRPVLFSYALLALTMAMLEREDRRWTLPLIIWLWASLHGSFVLGIGLIVLYGLARKRAFVRDAAAAVVAATLTAHGVGVWLTLRAFLSNRDALDLISEWAPPRLTSPDLAPYLILIAVVVVGAAAGNIERRDLWIVLPFLLFGLTAARSLFPAVIVLAPFAARAVGGLGEGRVGANEVGLPIRVVVAMSILALPFLVSGSWDGLSEQRFPLGIEAIGEGPLFHDDVVGGYLIYAQPDVPVYVDDRAELFGAEHFEELILARNGRPGWDEVFEENGFTQALVRPNDGIVTVLELEGWSVVEDDGSYVLLTAP